MSGICGVFSPNDPGLFSAADLAAMGGVQARRGVRTRTFVDAPGGVGLSLFQSEAFAAPGEAPGPAWLEDGVAVVGLAGTLSAALPASGAGAGANPQAAAVKECYFTNGSDFAAELDGAFSLFVWDKEACRLTLATDIPGSHQLYFYSEPGSGYFAFATELKALLKLARVPRQIDLEAVAFYLRIGYVGAPLTILKSVSKALPFERLSVDESGTVERNRYYSIPQTPPSTQGPLEEWKRPVHDAVVGAVERVTRRTPALALLLSGGIDSRILLGALHEIGASRVSAFTFETDGHAGESEAREAAGVARLAGVEHEIVSVGTSEISPALLSAMLREFDEPTDCFSRAPTEYFLSDAAARKGITSSLSGMHGETAVADFGWLRHLGKLDQAGGSADIVERLYSEPIRFFSPRRQREIMAADIDANAVIRRVIRGFKVGVEAGSDFQTYANVDGICDRTGRISLAGQTIPRIHGVEERAGFADRELIEFGQIIPLELRGIDRKEKAARMVLRSAFAESLSGLADEPAKGVLPGLQWQSVPWLVDLVLRQVRRSAESGLLKQDAVAKLLRKYRARSARRDFLHLWHIFALQTWIDFNLLGFDPFEEFSDGRDGRG